MTIASLPVHQIVTNCDTEAVREARVEDNRRRNNNNNIRRKKKENASEKDVSAWQSAVRLAPLPHTLPHFIYENEKRKPLPGSNSPAVRLHLPPFGAVL